MQVSQETEVVTFSTKGQVVVPQWLRKEFQIEEGTRAVIGREGDRIVLTPINASRFRRLRGILKKGLVQKLEAEHERERQL